MKIYSDAELAQILDTDIFHLIGEAADELHLDCYVVCESYLLSLAVLIEAINSLRIVPHRFNNIFAASALSRFAL